MANDDISSADYLTKNQDHSVQNEVLVSILQYISFKHNQGFAVMVNGPWGSGKTTFIKNNIERFETESVGETKQKALYVSLYGVTDVSQIEDRLFEQMHPILTHKATRLAGAFLRGAAKAALRFDIAHGISVSGSAAEVDLGSMMRGAQGRVIIFDDLERAETPVVTLLGYINLLVEHDGCKIVILADERHIQDDDYAKRKEKTIGRTFEFKPDVAGAYGSFLAEIDDPSARKFLSDMIETVQQVFADSTSHNLRLLKQFMWDFEKLWSTLLPEQKECHVAMKDLLELLCASSIELRSGLSLDSYSTLRQTNIFFGVADSMKEKAELAEQTRRKYPTVNFGSPILDVEILTDLVFSSKVNSASVRSKVGLHPALQKLQHARMPSWWLMWHSIQLTQSEQQSALTEFEADFVNRKFTELGEIFHVIGVAIWLAKLDLPGWQTADLKEKLLAYVHDVFETIAPKFESTDVGFFLESSGGAFGLVYMEREHPLFQEVAHAIRQRRIASIRRSYPGIAKNLL